MSFDVINNERDLLRRVAKGDEQAFTSLFYSYKKKLFSFIFELTNSRQQTEDILQEVFLRIWLNRVKLEAVDNFNAYLFRVSHNYAIDQLRKLSREILNLDDVASRESIRVEEPEAAFLQKEVREKIWQAIDLLPPQQKKIYILHRELGMKHAEIASELHLSVSTVQNHMLGALKNIRKHLTDYYPAYTLWSVILVEFLALGGS